MRQRIKNGEIFTSLTLRKKSKCWSNDFWFWRQNWKVKNKSCSRITLEYNSEKKVNLLVNGCVFTSTFPLATQCLFPMQVSPIQIHSHLGHEYQSQVPMWYQQKHFHDQTNRVTTQTSMLHLSTRKYHREEAESSLLSQLSNSSGNRHYTGLITWAMTRVNIINTLLLNLIIRSGSVQALALNYTSQNTPVCSYSI